MKGKILALTILLLGLLPGIAAACPNCKEAYLDSGASLASGFTPSILFMMITPFVVMGGIGYHILRSLRKKQREDAQALGRDA